MSPPLNIQSNSALDGKVRAEVRKLCRSGLIVTAISRKRVRLTRPIVEQLADKMVYAAAQAAIREIDNLRVSRGSPRITRE